jgi:hypothetical protein
MAESTAAPVPPERLALLNEAWTAAAELYARCAHAS